MIAIVHSIYSQSVHAPALNAGLMDNDAELYCTLKITMSTRHIEIRCLNQIRLHEYTMVNLIHIGLII